MKIVELLTAIQLPITNEEAEVLSMLDETGVIKKSELAPRQQLLANQLVSKDVLTRKTNEEGKIIFKKKIR
jgi:hypothetical protein